MATTGIYQELTAKTSRQEKSLAVLIDPDKQTLRDLQDTIHVSEQAGADLFFVGSSLLLHENFSDTVIFLKKNSNIPVVLFPGSRFQISQAADAILLLSLISGRNPELLIGQHVQAAPELKRSGLEIIPTGYMLIDGGNLTTVNYMSQSIPIPFDKPEVAAATALAGEMLGLQLIYLEAGSGAKRPVRADMIEAVRQTTRLPLVVGGGIRSAEKARENCLAGADVIVVGNGFEEEPSLAAEIAAAVHGAGKSAAGKTVIA